MVAGVVTAQIRGAAIAETARYATACSLAALSVASDATGAEVRAAIAAFAPRVQVIEA
jgi:sugar/nucleoside kinase (ribokinase family)